MFTDILETNYYSIIIDISSIIPPMSFGKYEAKVTKIYDRKTKRDIALTSENTCLSWGSTEDEAYKKAQARAKEWAERQR